MHPWVWGRMRLYGVQGTQSVRADDEPETRPNHRGGGQHSTVDHHRKASKAAHFSRKSAAPRLHRRLEKILPIEFFFFLEGAGPGLGRHIETPESDATRALMACSRVPGQAGGNGP